MGLAEMFRKKSKESEEDVTSEEDEIICPHCSEQIKFDEDNKPKFDEYSYGCENQISIFVCPHCKKILGFASNPEY